MLNAAVVAYSVEDRDPWLGTVNSVAAASLI